MVGSWLMAASTCAGPVASPGAPGAGETTQIVHAATTAEAGPAGVAGIEGSQGSQQIHGKEKQHNHRPFPCTTHKKDRPLGNLGLSLFFFQNTNPVWRPETRS